MALCSWVLCSHLAHSWLAGLLLGVTFSMQQAAQLKLPRQTCGGPFLIARALPNELVLISKLKINAESTASRNTLLCRGPIQKSHPPVSLTAQSKLAGAQKPWMCGPMAEVCMGWVKMNL